MARKAGRQNDMLDLLKCISIYSVVLAHVPLPGQFGRAICALAKFSVPVFFLISGYFSWGKDSRTLGRRAVHGCPCCFWPLAACWPGGRGRPSAPISSAA